MSHQEDLSAFIDAHAKNDHTRIEERLERGYVRLNVAEAEARQAKHDIRCIEDIVIELLRNSRDAGASNIYLAIDKQASLRTLVILDDGDGIPASMHKKIFDARVTSKLDSMHVDAWGVHGRGMALFSITQNATSADVLASAPHKGCVIRVICDTNQLPEKTDQSTWPKLTHTSARRDTKKKPSSRETSELSVDTQEIFVGPHNIARAVSEFAWAEKGRCNVYLGSFSEIVATLYAASPHSMSTSDVLFVDALDEVSVCDRMLCVADAQEMIACAHSFGLEISERTCHRILSGSIPAIKSVTSRLSRTSRTLQKPDIFKSSQKISISAADKRKLELDLMRVMDTFAKKYYLVQTDTPSLRIQAGKISVSFSVESDD